MPRSAILLELREQLFSRNAFLAVSVSEGIFQFCLKMSRQTHFPVLLWSVDSNHGALRKRGPAEDDFAFLHSAGQEFHAQIVLQGVRRRKSPASDAQRTKLSGR